MRFMPTSITVAPGFTQSPLTISGPADGGDRTSARRQTAARSRVREWQTVTVAFGVDEQARQRPTDEDRAADDHRLGTLELDAGAVEDLDHTSRSAGRSGRARRPARSSSSASANADPALGEIARR